MADLVTQALVWITSGGNTSPVDFAPPKPAPLETSTDFISALD